MTEHTDEIAVYALQGYGNNSGFGEKLAIIAIDFINSFAGTEQFGVETSVIPLLQL